MVALNLLAGATQPKQDVQHTSERERNIQASRRGVPKLLISVEPSNNPVLTFCNHGLLDQALHTPSLFDPSSASVSVSHSGLTDACRIHRGLSTRTVYSWTAIISAYVDSGQSEEALRLYHCMGEDGVEPDDFTFVSLLRACGNIHDLVQGRKLHDKARNKGYDMDLFVGASLVTMYGNCGSIVEAENAFCGLCSRDVVCWSAMLSAYVQQGQGEKALQIYRQMQQGRLRLDTQAFVGALQACGTLGDTDEHSVKTTLEIAQALHADARKKSLTLDPFVSTVLVSLYEKFGTLVEAENVFLNSSEKNIALWTVMFSAYVQNNQAEKSLQLYEQMLKAGIHADEQTFVIVLQACCILAREQSVCEAMDIVRAIHMDVRSKGLSSNVVAPSL